MEHHLTLFLHMHKSGGESIARHLDIHLQERFLQTHYLADDPDVRTTAAAFIRSLPTARHNGLRVIFGHNVTDELIQLFPERYIELALTLRYPPDQIVSTYNFFTYQFHERLGKPAPDFEEWYAQHPRNFQTLWLAYCFPSFATSPLPGLPPTEQLLLQGISILKHFQRVFPTARLDTEIAPWFISLGLPPEKMARHHVTGKDHPKRIQLDNALEERLLLENSVDLALYREAEQFGHYSETN